MATLANAPRVKRTINGKKVLLKDPTEFLIEGLSLPKDELLPENYFEFCEIIALGCMGSGKSVIVKEEIAPIARDLWTYRDEEGNVMYETDEEGNIRFDEEGAPIPKTQIDFIAARDIGGTIDAMMRSTKYVKFVFFDDAVGKGKDARQSMTRDNISSTQKFLVIRHLVAKGVLRGGYIILVLAAQALKGIDVRIREHAGVFLLKSYVKGCEDLFKNSQEFEKLKGRLKYLQRNAVWAHRKDVRKMGVAIDIMENSYEIVTDMIRERQARGEQISKIEWKSVEEGTTFTKHFNELVSFCLTKMREFPDASASELKGAMIPKLAEMEKKYYFCEVSETYFAPAIWRAKWLRRIEVTKENLEKKKKEKEVALKNAAIKQEQTDTLITFVFDLLRTHEKITISELKGALEEQIPWLEEDFASNEINYTDFRKIIYRAKFRYKEWLLENKGKKDEDDSEGTLETVSDGWTGARIAHLHDTLEYSFHDIERKYGIPHSTAYNRYSKFKADLKSTLDLLQNPNLNMESV